MVRQKWWVEAKGGAATVKRATVIEHVQLAAGKSDVDCLVIATNMTFSNQTRDWVRDWQASHPRPTIRLWDRHDLERLLSTHPDVVVRFFAEALSRQGQLEVIRSRFWNYATYTGRPSLKLLWKDQDDLEWDSAARLAVVISEAANGSFTSRPWTSVLSDADVRDVLSLGLLNLPYFCCRADSVGSEQTPYFKGLAYLLLSLLARSEASAVSELLTKVWDQLDGGKVPHAAREYMLRPVLAQLHGELRDVCTSDCERVSMDLVELTRKEVDQYWLRLGPRAAARDEDESDDRILTIEHGPSPCRVGFQVDMNHGCPLVAVDDHSFTLPRLDGTLEMFKRVIDARRFRPM
jgi:hypothetical protein